jgi:hypothetical protein
MTTHEKDTHGRTSGRRARVHRGQRASSCPPHSPVVVEASEGGYYAATCLACGSRGPEREDVWEAKSAFDEAFLRSPR